MALYLVRHGRTANNARGLLQGRSDLELDATGVAQVQALRTSWGPLPATARVIASPLRRARQTAELLVAEASAPLAVEVDERFIEVDYGTYEGRPVADVPPDEWDRWRRDPHHAPPGGEAMGAVYERVAAATAELLAQAAERDVVVVSHVSPIKMAVAWALGHDVALTWRLFLAPASRTTIDQRPDGTAVLTSFNETLHHP